MKKQMGIDITQVICADDDSDITEEQLNTFFDEFIALVASHSWGCGGGCGLTDVNEVETDPIRELLLVLGAVQERLSLGLCNEAADIIDQTLARQLRGSG